MTQISLQIPDDLLPVIASEVTRGGYQDASSLFTSFLYGVKAQNELRLPETDFLALEKLREAVTLGAEQLKRGETGVFDAAAIIARGRARFAQKQLGNHGG
jgi:Arc/MetJ-type ribon-helix-helix transcriptional regulator